MRIEHVAMYVKDLEKAKVFFETYFHAVSNSGYWNPRTKFRSYFLTFDDGARLELMHRPELDDSNDKSSSGPALFTSLSARAVRKQWTH